jgi:hypothetical protein
MPVTTVKSVRYPARAILVILDRMPFGEHSLMQDARHNNTFALPPVKHYMPTMLYTAQPRPDIITGPTERGIVGELSATGF